MLPTGLLTRTCRIRPYLREGMGGPVYGEWEERICRVEEAPAWHAVRIQCGGIIEEIPVKARLFLNGTVIPTLSEVEIAGRRMRALTVAPIWGFGLSHVEVELG